MSNPRGLDVLVHTTQDGGMQPVVRLLDSGDLGSYEQDVWKILCEVNREFIPPLSARKSTTTEDLRDLLDEPEPVAYFVWLLSQRILVASLDDQIVGFMSFRPHAVKPQLGEHSPATYVTTIAVIPSARQLGVARQLYAAVANLPADVASPHLATRTWSTNYMHLSLLDKLGFKVTTRLPDNRGANIDTLYLATAI